MTTLILAAFLLVVRISHLFIVSVLRFFVFYVFIICFYSVPKGLWTLDANLHSFQVPKQCQSTIVIIAIRF